MDASTLTFIMKLGALLGKGPCSPVAECGGKFIEKPIIVDHFTDVHIKRKLFPLCPETINDTRNFNIQMSQIYRMWGANHV